MQRLVYDTETEARECFVINYNALCTRMYYYDALYASCNDTLLYAISSNALVVFPFAIPPTVLHNSKKKKKIDRL